VNAPQDEIELAIENALLVERNRIGAILDRQLCLIYKSGVMCEHPSCYHVATIKLQVVLSK